MKAGNRTSLATLPPNPGVGEPSAMVEGPTSVRGASPAEDKGQSSHRPGTPAQANSASSDGEWLIDQSTKSFYLSLFTSGKAQTPKPKTVQPRVVRRDKHSVRTVAAPSKAPPAKLDIKLGDVRESRTYASVVLILIFSFAIYEAISRSSGGRGEPGVNRRISRAETSPAPPTPGQTAAAHGPVDSPPVLPASGVGGAPALSVAPTLILADVRPEQAATYTLVINNLTPQEFTFELEGKDLVLKDGKAVFLPPGEAPNSVAANLTFNKKSVNLKPMQSGSFDVTVSMPAQTPVRGVLIVLKGSDPISVIGQTEMTTSLGTLISFTRPETVPEEEAVSPQRDPASPTRFIVSQWLSDPVPECRGSNNGLAAGGPSGNPLSTPSGGGQR